MSVQFIFCGLCLFLFFSVASSELRWESKTVQLDLHPLQVTGGTAFHFRNAGTNTVNILAVRTTCGCLKASVSTNKVAAGESGAVDVIFDFHDKVGPQRKGVAVRISDSKPVLLYVQGNVPEVYTLSAKRLEWRLSSDLRSKSCRLVNKRKEPARLISAAASSDSFAVELIPVHEGFEYEVRVCPASDATPGKSIITVQTECPPELGESRSYNFSAYLR